MFADKNEKPFHHELNGYKRTQGHTIVNYKYRKAALVIWPRGKSLQDICSSNFDSAISFPSKQVEELEDVALILENII